MNILKKKKQQFNFTEFVMKKKKDKTALGITQVDNIQHNNIHQ